jgi:hypothetical protein
MNQHSSSLLDRIQEEEEEEREEQEEEEEIPPFALADDRHLETTIPSLLSLVTPTRIKPSPDKPPLHNLDKTCAITSSFNDSLLLQHSAPPGLVESIMTDESSSIQSASVTGSSELRWKLPLPPHGYDHQSPHQQQQHQPQQQQDATCNQLSFSSSSFSPLTHRMTTASSSYLMSSLQTIYSDAEMSTFPPHNLSLQSAPGPATTTTTTSPSASDAILPRQSNTLPLQQQHQQQSFFPSSNSMAFSQLMRAADDTNVPTLGLSMCDGTARPRPAVPEEATVAATTTTTAAAAKTAAISSSSCHVSGAWIIDEPTMDSRAGLITHPSRSPRWIWPIILPSTWGVTTTTTTTIAGRMEDRTVLQTPLLLVAGNCSTTTTPFTQLLSPRDHHHQQNQNAAAAAAANIALHRARNTIQAVVEDERSFQVSMQFHDGTIRVEDVMRIIGDPELLRFWCDPIETLIVVSNSSNSGTKEEHHISDNNSNNNNSNNVHGATATTRNEALENDRPAREYEGEWIEATTTALGSPNDNNKNHNGFLYRVRQYILETLGLVSYGRITMFVERQRGHVGLTIGPFYGGIHASHTITVSDDQNGRVNVLDRVRLTRNDDEEETGTATAAEELFMFRIFGCFDTCLSRCMLPSMVGYLNQVTTSMARLRLLVENSDWLSGKKTTNGSILMVVNSPNWQQ